jgi:hypothetical protein
VTTRQAKMGGKKSNQNKRKANGAKRESKREALKRRQELGDDTSEYH